MALTPKNYMLSFLSGAPTRGKRGAAKIAGAVGGFSRRSRKIISTSYHMLPVARKSMVTCGNFLAGVAAIKCV
jgi:hypothetical protein